MVALCFDQATAFPPNPTRHQRFWGGLAASVESLIPRLPCQKDHEDLNGKNAYMTGKQPIFNKQAARIKPTGELCVLSWKALDPLGTVSKTQRSMPSRSLLI